MEDGQVRTEADSERMAIARTKGGHPSLGGGVSPVLQVRLDDRLPQAFLAS